MTVRMSYFLVIMSVISFMLGVVVKYKNKLKQRHIWLFVMLSVASGCWTMSYTCIGMLIDTWLVEVFRIIYSGSIAAIVLTSTQLILVWVKAPNRFHKFFSVYSVVAAFFIYYIVAIKGIVTFVPYSFGFYYRFSSPLWAILYYFFIFNSCLFAMLAITYGNRKAKYHRHKLMAHKVFVCLLLLLAGILWDLVTASIHKPILPGSVIAQFVGVFTIFLISEYYNVSTFTVENVADYIYSVVDTPIVVLREEERICFVNSSCPTFFNRTTDELLQMHLTDLFEEDNSYEELDAKTGTRGETVIRAKCLLNDKKCELRRNKLHDRYNEMLGEMILVYDVTDKVEMLDELKESKKEAIEANEAKSTFLANMSHEIRTPMNAIVGMSEILLSRGVPEEMENELSSIHNAGTDLLSIINDILDISKIESGKYEIIESEYMLSNVVTDVVNMMAIRLLDKQVHLLVEMDPQIPAVLVGDDIRLKQILVNIVGNAVKFTKKGYIKLHIWGESLEDSDIILHASVKDSGIGIQKENMDKLFDMFSQVDTKKNRKITGTGLGLAISKNLCELMGGSIGVESVYKEGTTFTITVKQRINDTTGMIQIKDAQQLNLLVYEINEQISENIDSILNSLKIPHIMCNDLQAIHKQVGISHLMLRKKHFVHSRELFEQTFDQDRTILIMDIGERNMASWHTYKQLYLPLLYFQIGILLNNLSMGTHTKDSVFDLKTIIPMPQAKVLVVDDNKTNLMVIKGMLKPYEMQVDEALSGYDALVCVEKEKYDAIFMDHMMPDMDGVETTARIRDLEGEYYKKVPIIALTANSYTGARENFIKNGFDEYLYKPVQYEKLNRVLCKFIVPKQTKKVIAAHLSAIQDQEMASKENQEIIRECIDGVAMKDSVNSLGGNLKLYINVLRTYLSDMDKRKDEIRQLLKQEDWNNFTIGIHAMKSASYGVGAMRLGKIAEALEHAGKVGDYQWIHSNVEDFYEELNHIIAGIREYLLATDKEEGSYDLLSQEKTHRDKLPYEDLQAIRSACEDMDFQTLESVLENVNQYEYGEEDQGKLRDLTVAFNDFDYDYFMELLNEIL